VCATVGVQQERRGRFRGLGKLVFFAAVRGTIQTAMYRGVGVNPWARFTRGEAKVAENTARIGGLGLC
jgi:hypothetical protein